MASTEREVWLQQIRRSLCKRLTRVRKTHFQKRNWNQRKKVKPWTLKSINYLSSVFFSGSASVLLRYHYPLGDWKPFALLCFSRAGSNCFAWHIPCFASSLRSSIFQPVLSSVKIFKYYHFQFLSECCNKKLSWRITLNFFLNFGVIFLTENNLKTY